MKLTEQDIKNMKQHEILRQIETLNKQHTELEEWYINTTMATGESLETCAKLQMIKAEVNQLVKLLK